MSKRDSKCERCGNVGIIWLTPFDFVFCDCDEGKREERAHSSGEATARLEENKNGGAWNEG